MAESSKWQSAMVKIADCHNYDVEFTEEEEIKRVIINGLPFPSNDTLSFFIGRNK